MQGAETASPTSSKEELNLNASILSRQAGFVIRLFLLSEFAIMAETCTNKSFDPL